MPSTDSKREKAREVVDILEEISLLLVSVLKEIVKTTPMAYEYPRIRNWIGHSCRYVSR